jgi:hypothetical protein
VLAVNRRYKSVIRVTSHFLPLRDVYRKSPLLKAQSILHPRLTSAFPERRIGSEALEWPYYLDPRQAGPRESRTIRSETQHSVRRWVGSQILEQPVHREIYVPLDLIAVSAGHVISCEMANVKGMLTKLEIDAGKPSMITASNTPISTPSSRALVAIMPRRLPENASCSMRLRSLMILLDQDDISQRKGLPAVNSLPIASVSNLTCEM